MISKSFLLVAVLSLASFSRAETPIKTLATAKGKFFGCAVGTSDITDTAFTSLVSTQCSVSVPGNAMKWDATETSQNTFTYTDADAFMAFANKNSLSARGHTLLWHNQLPTWVSGGTWTNATLTSVIQNHVTNVVTHFKGQILAWDVVNEIFNEDGSFRTSVFYNVLGSDFVKIAFNAARAADPNAKLYINDYNIENPGSKATAMANLVTKLKAEGYNLTVIGVPIDGIGSQCHLIVGSVSKSNIQSQLQTFANLGVEVTITELDIRAATPISTSNLAQQQTDYNNVFTACLAVTGCKGIVTWGISDRYSWIPTTFSGYGDALPYDKNLLPKPAYNGIALALGGASISLTATPSPTPVTTLPSGSLAVYIGNGLESSWSDWSWKMTNSFFGTTGPSPSAGSANLLATPQQDNAILSLKGSVFTSYRYLYFDVATDNTIAGFRLEASTETSSGSQFATPEVNLTAVCTGALSSTSWSVCVVDLQSSFATGHNYDRLDWHVQSGKLLYLNKVYLSNTAPSGATVTITQTVVPTTTTTTVVPTSTTTTVASRTTTTTVSSTSKAPTTTTTITSTKTTSTTSTTITSTKTTTTTSTTTSKTTTTTSSAAISTTTGSSSCVAHWGQCGGLTYTGS
ncbi:hypothetical protein HK096_004244, partial [Nowakowskiella sp. JEL0078]